MAYNVTSSFISLSRSKSPSVVRRFTLAGSDYSQWVSEWPKFKKRWDEIRPTTLNLKLANGSQEFNFLRSDKTLLEGQALLKMGFDLGGEETIDLFAGTVRGVKYSKEQVTLTIVDKFQQLSDRLAGSTDQSVDYVGSSYLPSDLAWWAVTSFGSFDTTADSSNTDIDYPAFADWAAIFSGDGVFMEARWDGQKITEILKKISRQTHSAIFIKENKLSFHRFGIADTNVTSLGPDQVYNMDLEFHTDDIINTQFIAGGLTVGSVHQFTVVEVNTTSVNSFGQKENLLKDDNLWYVDSSSAINLAQRKILANSDPDDRIKVTAGLVGLPRLVGETITVLDAFHSISESYRILESNIDMDKGISNFVIDRTQLTNQFILDTSSLGSTTDVLT